MGAAESLRRFARAVRSRARGAVVRLRGSAAVWARRLRRIERRELGELQRWLADTDNLLHVSALLFVPFLVAVVTVLSNVLPGVSFLLFPPLAAGTYTLFADPGGEYADPVRFVVGVTGGAACGWVGLQLEALTVGSAAGAVSPGGAAVSILLVGATTWAFGVEEPAAFSAALLVLAAPTPWRYVLFTLGASTLVAVVFTIWRETVYESRATFLYGTVRADDHVLVPLRGTETTTALFGARLAAAHEAGKVVLLEIVDDEQLAAAERRLLERRGGVDRSTDTAGGADPSADSSVGPPAGTGGLDGVGDTATGADPADRLGELAPAVRESAQTAVDRVETVADRVRTVTGVPVEVVVATGEPGVVVGDAAAATNCDLIVTGSERGTPSPFVGSVFQTETDAVALQSVAPREAWLRVLVLVARPGDTAHAMVDFATRLAGTAGTVSVCSCIDTEAERRRAEAKLNRIVDTTDAAVETRVAVADLLSFVDRNAPNYDLIVVGASRDRSAASRLVSPPTFERLDDVSCDVAVVDRGKP